MKAYRRHYDPGSFQGPPLEFSLLPRIGRMPAHLYARDVATALHMSELQAEELMADNDNAAPTGEAMERAARRSRRARLDGRGWGKRRLIMDRWG